jgi:hypothetical protein
MHPLLVAAIILGAVAIPLTIVYVVLRIAAKAERRIIENGTKLRGWIVQANAVLFEPIGDDAPAQIIISFDTPSEELDERMQAIAEDMGQLKDAEPNDLSRRRVAALVSDERYRPGKRVLLPLEFTEGLKVYSAHVWIKRSFLPRRHITRSYVMCKAIPGADGDVIMIRYDDDPKASPSPSGD